MTFDVSDLENPFLRRKLSRSSSRAGDDPLPCGGDAGDEWRGRRIGKARQRRCGFMGEPLRGKLGMANGDLLEILHAPEIAVHADGAEIEARNTKRLAADFAVPAIKSPEIQVRRSIRQPPRFDRVGIVDQKQEHVAVTGVKGRCVLGDVHEGIMRHGLPVEHARHLPSGVAGAIACDLHDGGNEFVVPDAPIVRPGDGAKLNASVVGFQGFDKLAAMREQAVLQVDG